MKGYISQRYQVISSETLVKFLLAATHGPVHLRATQSRYVGLAMRPGGVWLHTW